MLFCSSAWRSGRYVWISAEDSANFCSRAANACSAGSFLLAQPARPRKMAASAAVMNAFDVLIIAQFSPAIADRLAYHRSGTMPRVKIPEILMVETVHQPGSLAKVLQVIADAGLTIDHLQALRRGEGRTVWEITLEIDEEADRSLYERIDALPIARFVGKSDRVFDRHRGGKIRTESAIPITTQQVLRDIYTPGVARVCLAIKREPALAWDYTSLVSSVAIVTNGTAVLGLGNIGALAGLPVMDGKAALFSTLVGIHAVPILIDETDPALCIDHVASISSGFGAIQLEDFAAPACFEIEEGLRARLEIGRAACRE